MKDVRISALALHLAQKFLTERNRRILESAGEFTRFARIILSSEFDRYTAEASAIMSEMGESLITWDDPEYPAQLSEIDYAPFALYARGNRALLKADLLSVVGTREPSPAGRNVTASLVRQLSAQGKVIVSGIARGVDSIAHHAALEAGGATIAVLPNGFNHLYPLENRDLYAMAGKNESILFISEYAPETKPQRHHFVRRNRIIAGLSPLTVFAEGGVKSGGMITVNHALSYGREVAALAHTELTNNAGGERLVSEGALDLTNLVFAPMPSDNQR